VRVMECNFCGEALSGANDDDLVATVSEHLEAQHPDSGLEGEAVRELVGRRAYDASDS
jgi:predicted small metal-binding protein